MAVRQPAQIAVPDSRPGPDALRGRNLVPGNRRCHLPEHQPGGTVRSGSGGDFRRRSCLPHEHHQHDRISHRQGGRSDGGGHSRAARHGQRVRRDRSRRRRTHPGVPREESRRPLHAGRPQPRVCLHGQLHLLYPHPGKTAARRCRGGKQPARFRPQHSPQTGRQGRDLLLRLPDQPHPRRTARHRALLA